MIPLTVDLTNTSGSGTSESYGFEYTTADLYVAMSQHKLPIVPHVDGTLYITINYDGKKTSGGEFVVKQNEKTTIDFSAVVSQYFTFSDEIEVIFQLKSSTTTYKALSFDAFRIK